MAHTKQTARKSTGGGPNKGMSVAKKGDDNKGGKPDPKKDPTKKKPTTKRKPDPEEDPEDAVKKHKPDPSMRPKVKAGRARKVKPMKREERTMLQIREARKGVDLCIPRLAVAR